VTALADRASMEIAETFARSTSAEFGRRLTTRDSSRPLASTFGWLHEKSYSTGPQAYLASLGHGGVVRSYSENAHCKGNKQGREWCTDPWLTPS
jgi:hypothetical protein